jgi:hypothetical protein
VKFIERGYGKLDKLAYLRGIRSTVGLNLPDFLVIGPTKTGTTWLYENLRCHPEVYMSEKKEIHYFDHHFHKSLRWYSDNFKKGNNKIKGEITPAYYSLSSTRINFIKTIIPDVRLILMLRNPIDRGWSHAVMNFTSKNKNIEEAAESEVFEEFKKQPFFTAGGYSGILDTWYSYFPRKQLYIGLYEDINSRPQKILGEIFSHIGVSTTVNWSIFPYDKVIIPPVGKKYENHNKSRGVAVKGYKNTKFSMPDHYRDHLKDIYRKDIESLQKNFGCEIVDWLDC